MIPQGRKIWIGRKAEPQIKWEKLETMDTRNIILYAGKPVHTVA